MSKTIVIASGKGGVGKSTTAAALGKILGERGHKTLIVDCDPALNSQSLLLRKTDALFSWLDVSKERCRLSEAICEVSENLYFLPAPSVLPDTDDEEIIKNALGDATADYAFVLFDAPAGLGTGLKRAAKGAACAVAIATADDVSVRGAEKVQDVLQDMGITENRLLINRYSVKMAKKGKLLTVDEVMDKTYLRLLGIVPEDKEITYAAVTGQRRNHSNAQRAFLRIADRIEGKNTGLTLSLLK